MAKPRRELAERAGLIVDHLQREMPNARIELDFTSPLELLVAVMLSAQCTDKRVNLVTPALFARYRTPQDYAAAKPRELEGYIKTCGLFRSKAKNIIAACAAIAIADGGGAVPARRDDLQALPGVGWKTAGVVSMHQAGGEPSFPVDTHVGRLARRMGFTRQTNPDKVEADLRQLLPSDRWVLGHQLLVWHGRRVCFARSPLCSSCAVMELCPKRGVPRSIVHGGREPARRG